MTNATGVTLLHLDGTLAAQELRPRVPSERLDLRDIRGTHGLCDPAAARELRRRLARRRLRGVTLLGGGNFHYVSYLLLAELREPFTLVLLDHHTDLTDETPLLSCGNWVRHALQDLPQLRRVVIVGARRDRRVSPLERGGRVIVIDETEAGAMAPRTLAQRADMAAGPWPVYVSIDKDVLRPSDARTDWDAGRLSLTKLLYLLVWLRRRRRILGVDICGEFPASPLDLISSQALREVRKNQAANQAILHALQCG
ncbi:MAG: arginase family protein [Thermoflavifilum sp.]|nr:arginase family protein [Thermoflavifilum sp.]MCL6515071.1 arginase family protein [Alicyclobacillus sp.]